MKLIQLTYGDTRYTQGEKYWVTGLNNDAHGGGCCGIHHLYNFPTGKEFDENTTHEQRIGWLRQAVEDIVADYACDCGDFDCENDRPTPDSWSTAVECVLVNNQLDTWRNALNEVGFKKVFEFTNDNTGNVCNVFYLSTRGG